ncbi:MAG: TonB-dependent receptor [Bacteroidetes bacterium]|nr:TonB-dependent receptor [Bacteroidota bacterium]
MIVLCSTFAFSQGQSVSGKIMDDQGQPIPGSNILEKGTGNGTVSDAQGLFTIKVSGANSTLVVSFIGFKTVEIPVNGQSNVEVTMEPDVAALSEVIVTGYTSERKQDLVSAVSVISAANTIAIPQSDVGQALQGRVAGVQVTTSGQPGTPSQVRIRGFGSFGNNTPLYVIDGVPTFDNSNVNPYDIESQTILKDAGAASIYGARAASGVIIITTKHGKYDGTTNVSLDINSGVTMQGSGIGILKPQDQANKVYEALRNTSGATTATAKDSYGTDINNPKLPDFINVGIPGGGAVGNVFAGDPRIATALANYNVDPSKGQIIQVTAADKGGVDWYKAMTRVAPVTRLSLGLSGGGEKAHYYANFTYFDQTGIAINQYLKRWNLRLNSEFKPMKNVRVGENLLLTYKLNPTFGNPQDENVLNLAYRMPTIIPVHDVNGNWAGTAAPGFNNPVNPVANLTRLSPQYNTQNTSQIFGNVYIEVDPVKHITLRSSFGGSIDQSHFLQLNQQTYENAENTSSNALSEGMGYALNYTFTNTIKYDNKLGDHSIKVLAGYEAIKNSTGRFVSGFGLNPFSLDPNYISLTNTNSTGRQVNSTPFQPYTFASVFAKVDYNLSDKYYLSAIIRRDGSSVFGPQNRYGVFPAVSAAWRISSESFMSGITWISDLKLRGGYGIMGNTNSLLSANAANQFTLFQGGPANGYDINGTNSSVVGGFIPLQVGNVAGKWEQNRTANIGIDGTFMNGTLDVILEVWQKNTVDLLFNPNFLNSGGVLPNNPFVNVGKMVNKGIDLQVIKRMKVSNEWSLTLDGNISPIHNEITQIASGQTYFEPGGGNFRNLQLVRNAVGQSISSFFGYNMIGYFKDAADASASPTQDGAAPGRFKFKDVNGDGVIDDKDRVFMGSPIPKFTYGLNINVKYKNWSLDAFAYGVYGNKIMNFQKWYTNFYQSFSGAGLSTNMLQSWTPALGNGAKTPIAESASNFSTNTVSNSWYMESGSYLRLKNLQINYNIPKAMLTKLGLQRVKIYAQAVNLFTITKYTGQDPEIVGNVDVTRGVDVGNYPATRYYGFGLNVGF